MQLCVCHCVLVCVFCVGVLANVRVRMLIRVCGAGVTARG